MQSKAKSRKYYYFLTSLIIVLLKISKLLERLCILMHILIVAPLLGHMRAAGVPLRSRKMQNIYFLTNNLRGGGNAGTQHQQ